MRIKLCWSPGFQQEHQQTVGITPNAANNVALKKLVLNGAFNGAPQGFKLKQICRLLERVLPCLCKFRIVSPQNIDD